MKKLFLAVMFAFGATSVLAAPLPTPTPSPTPTPGGLPIQGMKIQIVPNGAPSGNANHVELPPFLKKK